MDQQELWPLSIVICDIDGLRMINGAYGQEEGDYLIEKQHGLSRGASVANMCLATRVGNHEADALCPSALRFHPLLYRSMFR